jgi:hypothetical protein
VITGPHLITDRQPNARTDTLRAPGECLHSRRQYELACASTNENMPVRVLLSVYRQVRYITNRCPPLTDP